MLPLLPLRTNVENWATSDTLGPAFAPIAQLVEQLPFKETVPGSSPGGGTRI